MTRLIQETDRTHFYWFLAHHAVFFFIQVPIPFFMEKILDWLRVDPLSLIQENSVKNFIFEGLGYALALTVLYFIKCSAETSQRYAIACIRTQSIAQSQAYIANRVSNLPPGAAKYFDIGKITSMMREDCVLMGGYTYLRADGIVSRNLLKYLKSNPKLDSTFFGNILLSGIDLPPKVHRIIVSGHDIRDRTHAIDSIENPRRMDDRAKSQSS
jgi:hypothetical protein